MGHFVRPATKRSVHDEGLKKMRLDQRWGFAQFTDGKPDGEAVHKTCFPCHAREREIAILSSHITRVDLRITG
jgi:hypothetical protein